MSSQSLTPVSSPMLSQMAASGARPKIAVDGLTMGGVYLFITAILVMASGFRNFRPEVFGLLLHPCLAAVALAAPFVLLARIAEFPARILAAMIVFTGMYFFSILSGGSLAMGEVFRILSSVVTIVTAALLVRRRGDVVAGALGLSIGITLLAVFALQEDTSTGVQAMEAANKNSYSVYALPAILLAGFITLRLETVSMTVKSMFVASTLPPLVAIFMSGNRSGYLGAVVVGLMLFRDRRIKGLLLVGTITAAVVFWITQYGSTEVFDQKMRQTAEGYAGDEIRKEILAACWAIGLENPIIGISPQVMPYEISRRLSAVHHAHHMVIDPHNAFAAIFAGSGVICLLALITVGLAMAIWKPPGSGKTTAKHDPLFNQALRLMRMMLVLWVVRGMFTREILYNPSFNIALGLCIGFCMIADRARQSTARGTPLPQKLAPNGPLLHGARPSR